MDKKRILYYYIYRTFLTDDIEIILASPRLPSVRSQRCLQDEVRGILEIILHVICILDDCIRDNDAEDKEEKERDGKNAKEQPEDKDAAQDTEYNDECDDHDKECDDADDDPVHTLAHEPYYLKVFNF